MNLHGSIELLAGILIWIGFLLSLPIFGWLLGGTLSQAKNLGRGWKRPHGGKRGALSGPPLQQSGQPDTRGVSRAMELTASAAIPWLEPYAAAQSAMRDLATRLR